MPYPSPLDALTALRPTVVQTRQSSRALLCSHPIIARTWAAIPWVQSTTVMDAWAHMVRMTWLLHTPTRFRQDLPMAMWNLARSQVRAALAAWLRTFPQKRPLIPGMVRKSSGGQCLRQLIGLPHGGKTTEGATIRTLVRYVGPTEPFGVEKRGGNKLRGSPVMAFLAGQFVGSRGIWQSRLQFA